MSQKRAQKRRSTRGIEIPEYFVPHGSRAWDQVEWGRRSCEIRDVAGAVIFSQADVEAPEAWGQLAVDIAASKYFRRAYETSVREVIARVVQFVTRAGRKQKLFASPRAARQFAEELTHILLQQKGAFNSPVFFNCGVFAAYGLKGGPGLFKYDERRKQAAPVAHAYVSPQTSACFIQDVADDLVSIFELAKTEARIFKYGSGSGTNFSRLRGKDEPLESGGQSSGVLAFLDVLDRGAGATKSGGTTRRAAKMVILDVDHPEILAFIRWKAREEAKARALIAAGYDSSIDGEAYRTVGGQNANTSVRVSDAFMTKVKSGGSWPTRHRFAKGLGPTYEARELWHELAQAAWQCADPGVQFHDTINRWHTCPEAGEIRASNPCSEFMFLDETACNLASLNLGAFLSEAGDFDVAGFRKAIRILFLAQEILIDASGFPTATIAERSAKFRPLGLGFANLGGLLLRLGIPYDSDQARQVAAALTALMTAEAYRLSAEIARLRGAFSGFRKNRRAMMNVIRRHQRATEELELLQPGFSGVLENARTAWQEAIELAEKYGFRNAQATVIAPTGTIGLLMDCETTGIEPDFALVKYKKMVGGGMVKMVNASVSRALKSLNYDERQTDRLLKYLAEHETLEGSTDLRPQHLAVFDCATPGGKKGRRSISPEGHLKMMAAVQPFVSGAISKTVNLRQDISVAEVEQLFFRAWEMGLKSVAIYRDGSKFTQPLSRSENHKSGGGVDAWLKAKIEAPPCSQCGHQTVRAGTCFRCFECGHSESCA